MTRAQIKWNKNAACIFLWREFYLVSNALFFLLFFLVQMSTVRGLILNMYNTYYIVDGIEKEKNVHEKYLQKK